MAKKTTAANILALLEQSAKPLTLMQIRQHFFGTRTSTIFKAIEKLKAEHRVEPVFSAHGADHIVLATAHCGGLKAACITGSSCTKNGASCGCGRSCG